MAIDHSVPLTLWKREGVAACDRSLTLAHDFLQSCLRSADSRDRKELIEHCVAMDFRFARYAKHRARCPHCRQDPDGVDCPDEREESVVRSR
jgi:hypothetical protein